jgi:hypothetical protein
MANHPEEMDLFTEPETNAPYQKVQYVDYRSSSVLNDSGPLQFLIPPTSNQYIDLKRTKLHVKAKLVDGDLTPITDDKVGVINNVLHSMFGLVEIYLQQQLISSNHMYPYKAYIETLLDSGEADQKSYLQNQGFCK